jgi:hypothetical protein
MSATSLKKKILGTETLDHPNGTLTTRKGAEKFAKQNMQADLRRAGFDWFVVDTVRGWRIMYGKKLQHLA